MKSNLTVEESNLVFEALFRDFPDGYIPIKVFSIIENDIRPYMKRKGLRARYKGYTATHEDGCLLKNSSRKDSTHVILTYN